VIDRQDQDDDIASHVDSTKSISLRVEVVAVAFVLAIPVCPIERSWKTLERSGDHRSSTTQADKDADRHSQLLELGSSENTTEKEKNRDLCAIQVNTVHDLIYPEEL
jgi:hypothetical protein